MNFRFQNLLGAPYRGGNAVVTSNTDLISPVGNRISVVDLRDSRSTTLPCQASSNIARIAVSPDGIFLLAVDDNSRAIFINLPRRVVLHRITFKFSVHALKFSPDGALIAVATGKLVQLWRSPGFSKEFFPFELIRVLANCDSTVTSLDWSPDSKYVLVGSKDLTARLFRVKRIEDGYNKPFLFLGHKDSIVGVFFAIDKKTNEVRGAYTLARDCFMCNWVCNERENRTKLSDGNISDPPSPGTPEQMPYREDEEDGEKPHGQSRKRKGGCDLNELEKQKEIDEEEAEEYLNMKKWELLRKDNFGQAPEKISTCDYHRGLELIVVGFSNGVFGLYQMPDFVCIHLLSISMGKITTAVFNDLGNWLTFGCAQLGQLLVWEWRSETYILKQQGHYFDVNCLSYSSDSQFLATGADDHKIKVWTVSSGFCFVTFAEHTNAVTALHFTSRNNCLLSASLDGTVRAWDLFRYRNFRIFTTPSPRQFVSLSSDQSGEVVCAGTLDSFEIFVWSMKTGRLLDILSGHEGPVHSLMFSPINAILASSSWDRTVRLWDVFEGKGTIETFRHTHDVLVVAYRPDGKQLACATLDGQIHFWDPVEGLLMYTIEGRRDVAGGRLMTDRRSAANSSSGKHFTSLCYSADGSCVLAAGNSRYVCMYDVAEQVLLRRFQLTQNLSIDGVLDFLNSKNMTEAGPVALIDDDDSDREPGVDRQTRGKLGYDLPGSRHNRGRPVARTKCLQLAPSGRSWAAATTEGVLVFSLDESFVFDPTDLDIDVTAESVSRALDGGLHATALILSLRLNDDTLIKRCVLAAGTADMRATVRDVPFKYVRRLMEALAHLLESSPHVEFVLRWSQEVCKVHGNSIRQNSRALLPSLKSLQKAVTRSHQELSGLCSSNMFMLQYLCSRNQQ